MSEHTKGPWEWRKNGQSWILWGAHGMRPIILDIGQVHGVTSGGSKVLRMRDQSRDVMVEASCDHPDAMLIAAAPELLAACEHAIEAICESAESETPAMEKLKTAISKARGTK